MKICNKKAPRHFFLSNGALNHYTLFTFLRTRLVLLVLAQDDVDQFSHIGNRYRSVAIDVVRRGLRLGLNDTTFEDVFRPASIDVGISRTPRNCQFAITKHICKRITFQCGRCRSLTNNRFQLSLGKGRITNGFHRTWNLQLVYSQICECIIANLKHPCGNLCVFATRNQLMCRRIDDGIAIISGIVFCISRSRTDVIIKL